MSVLGDFRKLRELERRIKDLPTTVSFQVAAKSAEVITAMARQTFEESENAFGDPWLPGKYGQRVTLRDTGRLASGVMYVAIGTKLRARLGPNYAKYQVGLRPIFPTSILPIAYKKALQKVAADVCAAEIGKAA